MNSFDVLKANLGITILLYMQMKYINDIFHVQNDIQNFKIEKYDNSMCVHIYSLNVILDNTWVVWYRTVVIRCETR